MDSRNDDLNKALPNEILVKIGSMRASDFLSRLPETSKFYSSLYSSFLFTERNLAFNLLRKLLGRAALGELEDAESIYKLFPDLLTCRGTIYHPNRCYKDADGHDLATPIDIPFEQNPGRYKYIDRTFYQILLMNSEFEEAEAVGELMTKEEKQKQFNEVFPDGEIKKYDFDLKKAKILLQAVFDAVAQDEILKIERDENHNIKNIIMSDATRKALDALHHYAKPKAEQTIGLVFAPEFYYEALKLYDEKSDSQFKHKCDRYSFWNICVEEWLAGCLGTRFLRPHSQGLGNSLSRRGCVLADGSSVFAFRRSLGSLPGHHLFVGYYGAAGVGSARGRRVALYVSGRLFCSAFAVAFWSICQAATRAGRELTQQYLRQEKSACLIC